MGQCAHARVTWDSVHVHVTEPRKQRQKREVHVQKVPKTHQHGFLCSCPQACPSP